MDLRDIQGLSDLSEIYQYKWTQQAKITNQFICFVHGGKSSFLQVAQVDQMTQDRVVLRFLHDAFYYYLMNKGDAKEHLQAIMTMLDFSVEQKDEVAKRKGRSH
ncbi:hypothetical protein ANCCAN_25259 [Ancylostoma caninum]|uniref:GRIP domain-containing protein n=1 Tax=Ancylostoma caninum TaxID=29170 RepID=A0A368FA21_ANCCA|nr:hypothetical protein ANCCAN_25259 [Ancylostoma caninum]